MEYICEDKFCTYDGPKPFVLKIPQEVSVDPHNIATLFCPHCGGALTKKKRNDCQDDMASLDCPTPCGPQTSVVK